MMPKGKDTQVLILILKVHICCNLIIQDFILTAVLALVFYIILYDNYNHLKSLLSSKCNSLHYHATAMGFLHRECVMIPYTMYPRMECVS